MPDPRFYDALGPLTAAELAALTGGELADASQGARPFSGVAPLAKAGASDVAFLADARRRSELASSGAGLLFLRAADADGAPSGAVRLIVRDPQRAYCAAAAALHRPIRHAGGDERLHPDAEFEDGVTLAPGVVVGAGARIGMGAEIGPNSVIGPGVAIGRRCRIGANVSISFALIGDDVQIYAGAVIGEAGFGVAGHGGDVVDVPQLGRVIIQDHVTIGAATCVDRGAWDDTVIGERTKIDNMVQIAHNVRIGRNCALAAQVGISGSVSVGDAVMFGGGAGVADHLDIGSGARIAGAAGVMRNVAPGEVVCGTPARPIRQFMRETAWLTQQAAPRGEIRKDRDE